MFCKACGAQVPDGAAFCPVCGNQVGPVETTAAVHGAPPPRRNSRLGLWVGMAVAAAILIAAGLVLWLVVLDDDETAKTTSTTSTSPAQTTSTGVAPPATAGGAVASTSSTSASTASTSIAEMMIPGDSPGQWMEIDNSAFPTGAYAIALSDETMLIDAEISHGYALHAYMFASGELIELPIEATDFYDEDLEGDLAVWWEGDYREDTDEYLNEHVFAYRLPDGPKVSVTEDGRSPYYPQTAGRWLTWAEAAPWDEDPEDYWLLKIYGVQLDPEGRPEGDPGELVWAATSYAYGDVPWVYSLSGTHLAWENATAVEGLEAGVYVMDFGRFDPMLLATEASRPSLSNDIVVYYDHDEGLVAKNLFTGRVLEIDRLGDFATAAPSFAVYYRPVESDETFYRIMARGYSGRHEQVLGEQSDPPWMSSAVAASTDRVACVIDGIVHLFEWQAR